MGIIEQSSASVSSRNGFRAIPLTVRLRAELACPKKGIAPHIPVFDRSNREDGTFSRADFRFDATTDVYTAQAASCSERAARCRRAKRFYIEQASATAMFAR